MFHPDLFYEAGQVLKKTVTYSTYIYIYYQMWIKTVYFSAVVQFGI